MNVLVGYASMHGSTRGVAERIASRLGERGLGAEVRSFDDVADAAGYDAFVLGSALILGLYSMRDGITGSPSRNNTLSCSPP